MTVEPAAIATEAAMTGSALSPRAASAAIAAREESSFVAGASPEISAGANATAWTLRESTLFADPAERLAL